jgi:hypothetical protein|tara:strand:+ start:97 stop:468 length:372 start_codon:yes stop_codon:yes gene_type:complete
MNKIDLETKIEGLKKAIAEHKDFAGTYEGDLARAEQELKDIDKPELTSLQFDNLYEAVESGVSGYDFSDSDNFDYEFGIDYDNRVQLENFDISNSTDLVEAIVEEVSKLFAEKLDTTEVDNHA